MNSCNSNFGNGEPGLDGPEIKWNDSTTSGPKYPDTEFQTPNNARGRGYMTMAVIRPGWYAAIECTILRIKLIIMIAFGFGQCSPPRRSTSNVTLPISLRLFPSFAHVPASPLASFILSNVTELGDLSKRRSKYNATANDHVSAEPAVRSILAAKTCKIGTPFKSRRTSSSFFGSECWKMICGRSGGPSCCSSSVPSLFFLSDFSPSDVPSLFVSSSLGASSSSS
mmetsp:Transcript_10114/g.24346  ORF Transcript_10114/g.24346 Transcript_10114/m.24346 type:complete len:225 (-) Transcript_10114:134-808(-)